MRVLTTLVYGFSAWMASGLLVYAGAHATRPSAALRCAALAAGFLGVFRLYFRRPDSLRPWPAAGVTLALIAGLDGALLVPHLPRASDLFLSFWDWQLPALVVIGSILAAGAGASPRTKPQQGRH